MRWHPLQWSWHEVRCSRMRFPACIALPITHGRGEMCSHVTVFLITTLSVVWGQRGFSPWNSRMDSLCVHSFSYFWIMSADLNWGQWGPNHLSHWCALGSNLVGEPLLGRFTFSRFTPFMALLVVRWSPKAFSRLKNFNDCFSSVLDFAWIMAWSVAFLRSFSLLLFDLTGLTVIRPRCGYWI